MKPEVTTLKNGLRIASYRMPHLETVSLGVWVSAGSRHESESQQGISHLLEHMAFKGTKNRSALRIAEEIEEVGGELNASTGLDITAYYARVLKGDDGVALEILADILSNSAFGAEELEREREVILQEIAGAEDSPDDLAYELMHSTAFPDQAVGRAILGTRESVSSIQAPDLKKYLSDRYHPSSMVVSAAGAVDHDRLVRHVEALFGGLTAKTNGADVAARYAGGISSSNKSFEQSHVLIGLPGPSLAEADYDIAQVFVGIFGGGMSSRLFQEIRENRGLCYSIYATLWGLRDVGMIAIHAGTGPHMVDELAKLVAVELTKLADTGPTAAEMLRAKAQMKAGLLMALESASVRAEQMARHIETYDRIIPSSELVARVEAVTPADIKTFAAKISQSAPTVTVVGSGRKSPGQAKRAAALFSGTAAQAAVR